MLVGWHLFNKYLLDISHVLLAHKCNLNKIFQNWYMTIKRNSLHVLVVTWACHIHGISDTKCRERRRRSLPWRPDSAGRSTTAPLSSCPGCCTGGSLRAERCTSGPSPRAASHGPPPWGTGRWRRSAAGPTGGCGRWGRCCHSTRWYSPARRGTGGGVVVINRPLGSRVTHNEDTETLLPSFISGSKLSLPVLYYRQNLCFHHPTLFELQPQKPWPGTRTPWTATRGRRRWSTCWPRWSGSPDRTSSSLLLDEPWLLFTNILKQRNTMSSKACLYVNKILNE